MPPTTMSAWSQRTDRMPKREGSLSVSRASSSDDVRRRASGRETHSAANSSSNSSADAGSTKVADCMVKATRVGSRCARSRSTTLRTSSSRVRNTNRANRAR